jgi:predicted permease
LDAPAGAAALSIQALALLPVAAFLQISIGAILAQIYTAKFMGIRQTLLGIPDDDEESAADVRMCATFANSGPLPLMFADALFHTRKGILNDVTACVSFYLLVWSPLFWTLGRIILGAQNAAPDVDKPIPYSQWKKLIKLILSPPVIGCLMGVLVGSIHFLRNLFLHGPFNPIFTSCKSLGAAYLPAALLVLAGSLVGSKATHETRTTGSKINMKTVLTLFLSRFILAPTVALATMQLLSISHVLPTSNPRSLAIITYTMLMEGCMPPAQNSVVMLQLDGKRDRAAKMARLLTIMYTIATGPITLLLSACLARSGILNYY